MRSVVAVVGPTAVGKSELALRLAAELDGEVVNADSMQLYTGMDIGTAKLRPDERRGVPHHLLDVWPVTRTANVADYQRAARAAFEDVRTRGRLPLLVGGSGLYVSAAVDDLRFPGTDPVLRARLEAEATDLGPAVLHRRLAELDPVAAAAILPSNARRVVRALEVIALTGQRFSAAMPHSGAATQVVPVVLIGLTLPRAELDRRIAERVDRMWSAGFVAEVTRLERAGLRGGVTACRAVGYAQVLDLLAGTRTPEAAREATVAATRRLVRRQESWFGRETRISWLQADEPDLLQQALALAREASRR